MPSIGLKLEYALEGSSNLIVWKDRMEVVLDDNGLLEYSKTDIAKPSTSDAQQLTQWKKDTTKLQSF